MNLDMKINMVIQFIYKKIENRVELLLIENGDKLQDTKSHVYIKEFEIFMYNKTKHKDKQHFLWTVHNALAVKEFWHRKISQKLMMQEANVHKKGTKVEFANYYK